MNILSPRFISQFSIFLFSIFYFSIPLLASAQTLPSPSISLTINGVTSGVFVVGQSWNLAVTSNMPTAVVSLCAIDNHGSQGCTPNDGSTNTSGAWSLSGGFITSSVGPWQEWVQITGANSMVVSSNPITFTVSTTSTVSTQTSSAAVPSWCPTGVLPPKPSFTLANTDVTICSGIPIKCSLFQNDDYFTTLDIANNLASYLGATVFANTKADSGATYSIPEYDLVFPNSYTIPAGIAAFDYNQGLWPAFASNVVKPVCDPSFTTDGVYQVAPGGGTNGGTTQGTPHLTTVSNPTDAQNVTINNIYASTQQIAQQALRLYDQIALLSGNSNTSSNTSSSLPPSASLPNRAAILSLLTGVSSSTPANTSITFPVNISVTAPLLNVRSAPSISARLSGSQQLNMGDQFIAVSEVVGDDVSGNDLWWVSSKGNYVWSGGTTIVANNNG